MTEHGCQNQIGVWALTDRGGQEGDSSKENPGDDNLTKQGPPKQRPQTPPGPERKPAPTEPSKK